MMKSIEQILIDFAKIKQQIKELKKQSSEVGHCVRPINVTGLPDAVDCQSCIDICIYLKNKHNSENSHWEDYISFHEFFDSCMPFDVCDSCKKHIELKKKRKALNKPLGIAKAAISKRAEWLAKNG
jgi:hypothetical protein